MPELTTPVDVEPVAASAVDRYKQPLTILAPMVKAGTLALRLLALDHGADLVYTEVGWLQFAFQIFFNTMFFRK